MIRIASFIAAVLLLTACNDSNNIFNGRFRQAPEVGITDIACERLGAEVPGGAVCYLADTLLVVHTPMNPEWFFSLYSLNDFSLARQVVRVGNGPGEYPPYTLCNCDRPSTENGHVKMWVTDQSARRTLERIDLTRSLAEGRTVADSIVDVSEVRGQTSYWYPVGDRLWLNYCIDEGETYGEFGLLLYDAAAKEIIQRQPLYTRRHPDISLFSTAQTPSSDKTMWAGGMLSFPQINFIPLSDGKPDMKKAFSVSLDRHPVPLSEAAAANDILPQLNSYLHILPFADRFVASYHATAESTELHIFDDRGNLLHRLRLDCRVPYFDIDPASGALYGLCSEQLVRADIGRWLHAE